MTYNPATPPAPTDSLPIGNRAALLPGMALPDFEAAGGHTYAASYRDGDGSPNLLGVLCDKNLPPRFDLLNAARSMEHSAILRFVDGGPVTWPKDGRRYFALAYHRPMAPRMKNSVDEPHAPMGDDFLNNHFIAPMIGAMQELQRSGIVHHAIRPTNIFWRIGSASMPQLGEYLSAPPGVGQPALFEPLERAMSAPVGRGNGRHTDDCYALGVTLALLILGSNPMQGMDDATIIRTKMDRGTFGALIGTRRISPSHIEILRGLLADDSRQRWSGSDLDQWSNGRRATPKSTDMGKRAARAFDFMGQDYWQTRPLANAMAAHVGEASSILENGSLDKWLRRAVNDESRAANLASALASLKQSGKTANYEEQLVARACIALDPAGPIRYRGVAAMPAGIASMLADAIANGGNTQVISEIIGSQLVSLWVEMQQDTKTDMVPIGQMLERMKAVIEKPAFGNGVERVVYELNPGLQCLSPAVRGQYVTNGRSMLTALERVANSGERPQEPIDRHIAAFLIVRERRSEMLFDSMASAPGTGRRGLAMLALYADMQERYGPEALPGLAQWLMPMLEPVMQRFLGKTVKEKMREQVREAVTRGNLVKLLQLIDDPKRIERDQQEFMAARMLYLNIMKEIAVLENRIANRDAVVRESGKPMAASISTFIAILLVFAAVLRAVWQNVFGF